MLFNNLVVLLSFALILSVHVLMDVGCGNNQAQNAVLSKFTNFNNAGSFRTGSDIISKGVTPTELYNATVVEESPKEVWNGEGSISTVETPTGLSNATVVEESPNEGWKEEGHLITNVVIDPPYNGLRTNLGYVYTNVTLDNNVSEGSIVTLNMSYPKTYPKDNPIEPIRGYSITLKKENNHVVSFSCWFLKLKPYIGMASSEITVVDKKTGKKDVIISRGPIVDIAYLNIENNFPGHKICDGKQVKFVVDIRATRNLLFDLFINNNSIQKIKTYNNREGGFEELIWDDLGDWDCGDIIQLKRLN